MPTTYVLGLGNVLMGDDGFGPAVVRAFEAEYVVGSDVRVVDLGTPGLDLMPWFADVENLVIVDTVKSDLPPGSMRFYNKADLLGRPSSVRSGPHEPGVTEALMTLEFAGRAPRTAALIGVVPGRVGMELELTPVVRAALPAAVRAVADALTHVGAAVTRREIAGPVIPWWVISETQRSA